MTGAQWERLQAWQQAGPGRRVMVELDTRVPLFPPYDPVKVETIIVTAYQDDVASVVVKPEDIDRIDVRLQDHTVEVAQKAVENASRLLDKHATAPVKGVA